MLKFESSFTDNAKADAFLRKFVNDALKRAVAGIIECCEEKDDEVYFPFPLIYDDDLLPSLFPETYPWTEQQMMNILKGLYALLNSDKEFVPTIVMEYVLDKILNLAIELYYDSESEKSECIDDEELDYTFKGDEWAQWRDENQTPDKSINFPFTAKTRRMLVKAYTEMYLEESDIEDENESLKACKQDAEEMVDNLWHFSDRWLEFCFWDEDFEMLDDYSPEEFSQSELNASLGAMPEETADDAFYIPEDWRNDKGFHYLYRADED